MEHTDAIYGNDASKFVKLEGSKLTVTGTEAEVLNREVFVQVRLIKGDDVLALSYIKVGLGGERINNQELVFTLNRHYNTSNSLDLIPNEEQIANVEAKFLSAVQNIVPADKINEVYEVNTRNNASQNFRWAKNAAIPLSSKVQVLNPCGPAEDFIIMEFTKRPNQVRYAAAPERVVIKAVIKTKQIDKTLFEKTLPQLVQQSFWHDGGFDAKLERSQQGLSTLFNIEQGFTRDFANTIANLYTEDFGATLVERSFVVRPGFDKAVVQGNMLRLTQPIETASLEVPVKVRATYGFCTNEDFEWDFKVRFKNPVQLSTVPGVFAELPNQPQSELILRNLLNLEAYNKSLVVKGRNQAGATQILGTNPEYVYYDLKPVGLEAEQLLEKNQVRLDVASGKLIYIPDNTPGVPKFNKPAKFTVLLRLSMVKGICLSHSPRALA